MSGSGDLWMIISRERSEKGERKDDWFCNLSLPQKRKKGNDDNDKYDQRLCFAWYLYTAYGGNIRVLQYPGFATVISIFEKLKDVGDQCAEFFKGFDYDFLGDNNFKKCLGELRAKGLKTAILKDQDASAQILKKALNSNGIEIVLHLTNGFCRA